jgi:DNA polymerase III delta prime subunit
LIGEQTDKIAFIDEADGLTKPVQESLRYIIENSVRCRFIMTANKVENLTLAIRSRLQTIDFDSPAVCTRENIDKLTDAIQKRLRDLAVQHDPHRVYEIVATRYPDLRSIVNQVDFEFS